MRILGVIPARGGSKGVPRKNIRLLCGKPLLQYTAEAALGTKLLTRVILSTEDAEIAEVGRACGLEVPFMRPDALARDETPTLPVLQHAVSFLENCGDFYDVICLLQPTNPLRRSFDIDASLVLLDMSGATSVVSVLPVPPKYNPHWVYFEDDGQFLQLSTNESDPIPRRQELPAAYHRDGSIYAVRRAVLMIQNTLYGTNIKSYKIPPERSINIDTVDDWLQAEKQITCTGNT